MSCVALMLLSLAAAGAVAQGEPGLLFHARFDGTLEAFSLAGLGTPTSVDGPAPVYAPGRLGQALLCGPGQTLVHYTTDGNVMPRSGTISLWVCPQNWTPEDPNFHVFFESGTIGGGRGWLIFYKYYQGGRLLLRYADEREEVGMADVAGLGWQPGEWHHLAGTWTPEALRIYVDGELRAEAPRPLVSDTLADTFAVGDNGWHLPHEGARTLVDDVRIYAHPLSPAAIRRLAGGFTVTVSRVAGGQQWLARCGSGGIDDAAQVVFALIPWAGGEALVTVQAQASPDITQALLPVGDVPAGKYRVTARVLDAKGKDIARGEAPMMRLEQEQLTLGNEHLTVQVDGGTGGLSGITAPRLGLLCSGDRLPAPLFTVETVRLLDHARFYPPNAVQTLAASADALQSAGLTREDSVQKCTLEYLFPPGIRATVTMTLPDDSSVLTLRLRLENPRPLRPSQAVRIPRVTFPALSGLRVGDNPADNVLATGRIHGETLVNPAAALPPERTGQYPGNTCVPWQDLYGPAGGLWLGPLSNATTQLEPVCGAQDGLVSLSNRWWCLLEPGEVWESPEVEMAVHPGAWHWGAERFRDWSLQHTPPRQQPAWLDECHGWTGFGAPSYKFLELPQVYETARYYGFNYLQIWAQMILGGAYYCYFYPNPDLGTVEDLKRGLAGVHEAGGHVGFYSNVITFDGAIDGNPELRHIIDKYGLTDLPPLPRFYDEAIRSVFIGPDGSYGRGGAAGHSLPGYLDGYWAMDPCAKWWQDYLATWIARWHHEYGADVWYLDSFPIHGYGLGPASYGLHMHHPRSLSAGQLELLRRIRRDFDGPMLYEGVCCAAFMPYTNWCLGTELSFGSGTWSCPEIFAYSFSDVYPVFSGTCNTWAGIGHIWPDLAPAKHEDALNYVFLLGERFDTLGLHGMDRQSPFCQHVKALVALRAKLHDVVYKGRMRDRLGLSGMPPRVEARVFTRQEPAGAVVTIVDRRPDREPWTLQVNTADLPWPAGLTRARLLSLDGTEETVPLVSRDGVLTVPIRAAEVQAVRFDPLARRGVAVGLQAPIGNL